MTLEQSIETHRQLHRDDAHIDRLVSRHPPTTLDLNTGQLQEEPAAAIGMTVSGRLLRYVGHPDGMGSDFPWARSVAKLRYDCRRNHPHHRGADVPYWRGSLCHQFVRLVIMQGRSVEQAAQILRYDNPEPILRAAFAFIESTMDDFRAKAEKRAREDEGRGPGAVPAPERAHHAVDGLHQQECPQCRRNAA